MGCKKQGIVSIWIGFYKPEMSDVDVLKDLCGIDTDDINLQESVLKDRKEITPIKELLAGFPHSDSFIKESIKAAANIHVTEARWATVQYDYQYDPNSISRSPSNDPVFLGTFPYKK